MQDVKAFLLCKNAAHIDHLKAYAKSFFKIECATNANATVCPYIPHEAVIKKLGLEPDTNNTGQDQSDSDQDDAALSASLVAHTGCNSDTQSIPQIRTLVSDPAHSTRCGHQHAGAPPLVNNEPPSTPNTGSVTASIPLPPPAPTPPSPHAEMTNDQVSADMTTDPLQGLFGDESTEGAPKETEAAAAPPPKKKGPGRKRKGGGDAEGEAVVSVPKPRAKPRTTKKANAELQE